MFKNSGLYLFRKTCHIPIIKISHLMSKETIAVYSKNQTRHINTLCRQNSELHNIKAHGIHRYHCMEAFRDVLSVCDVLMRPLWTVMWEYEFCFIIMSTCIQHFMKTFFSFICCTESTKCLSMFICSHVSSPKLLNRFQLNFVLVDYTNICQANFVLVHCILV
jgi:hypothetical protein